MGGYTVDWDVLGLAGIGLGGVFVALLVVYLLFRELNCWYWKVNARLALLTEVRDLLSRAEQRALAEKEALAAAARRPRETVCRQCGTHFPGELAGQYCEKCGARL